MPRKKAVRATETRADLVDKIFAQVDPVELAIGALGAVATRGGLTPPITRMMQAFSTGELEDPGSDFAKVLALVSPAYGYYVYLPNWLDSIFGKPDVPEEQKQSAVAMSALMAAGAAEYMIFYNLARNPEFQKAAYGLMTSTAGGLGAIAKAL